MTGSVEQKIIVIQEHTVYSDHKKVACGPYKYVIVHRKSSSTVNSKNIGNESLRH